MFCALGSPGQPIIHSKAGSVFCLSVEPGPGLPGASHLPVSLCPEWTTSPPLSKAVPHGASFTLGALTPSQREKVETDPAVEYRELLDT